MNWAFCCDGRDTQFCLENLSHVEVQERDGRIILIQHLRKQDVRMGDTSGLRSCSMVNFSMSSKGSTTRKLISQLRREVACNCM
jgi:hypothetical protein